MDGEAQARNVELVRAGLDSWVEGDREAALARFTEDVEVYVPPELGNAGTYLGIEQFNAWIAAWEEAWSDFSMEVTAVEAVGDRHVIATVNSRGTGSASGVEVGNTLKWVFGVKDEELEHLSLQPDQEAAREYAAARESG